MQSDIVSEADNLRQLLVLMRRCLTEDNESSIDAGAKWIQNRLNCSSAIVCQIELGERISLRKVVNSGYNTDWIEHYIKDGLEEIDPVLDFACSTHGLFTWDQAYSSKAGRATNHFRKSAEAYELTNGYTFSYAEQTSPHTRRVTLCSVPTPAPEDIQMADYLLSHLVPAFHTKLSSTPNSHSPLSSREAEILAWARAGKTVWEQSKILNIAESTVKYHLLNCYRKLNVNNRAQAVAKGIELGLLAPL